MNIQLNHLRSGKSPDLTPLFAGLSQVLQNGAPDCTRLRLTCDWVQYKSNFREPLATRPVLDPYGAPLATREIGVDLRQLNPETVADELKTVIARLYDPEASHPERLYLEDFAATSRSLIWAFNAAYWSYLGHWERTFQRGFAAALPGGSSDGTHPDFIRESVDNFIRLVADLEGRGYLPEELFVLEIGVGSGEGARLWLDEFRERCRAEGRDYYSRVRYLMSDLSMHVLDLARPNMAEHLEQVSFLALDAIDPLKTLSFLRYKVLFIHLTNVYDNLPGDEVARLDSKLYRVEVRAYLPQEAVQQIADSYGLTAGELPLTINRFLRIGPEYFDEVERGVHFWRDVWSSLRLEERYVALEPWDDYGIIPGVRGSQLQNLLTETEGDLRFHLSNAALASFVNTLPLLHPRGIFQVQDIFVTELEQYRGMFRGPGKLDGSIVNWVNGAVLREVARRFGYDVRFMPFAHRARSRSSVLMTQRKE